MKKVEEKVRAAVLACTKLKTRCPTWEEWAKGWLSGGDTGEKGARAAMDAAEREIERGDISLAAMRAAGAAMGMATLQSPRAIPEWEEGVLRAAGESLEWAEKASSGEKREYLHLDMPGGDDDY